MRDLELGPLHETLRAAVADPARLPELLDAVAATGAPRSVPVVRSGARRARRAGPAPKRPATVTTPGTVADATRRRAVIDRRGRDPREAALLEAWLVIEPLCAAFGPGVIGDLRLAGPVEDAVAALHGLDRGATNGMASAATAIVVASAAPAATLPRLAAWVRDPALRDRLGVHAWEGVEWVDGPAIESLIDQVARAQELDGATARAAGAAAARLRRAVAAAGYRVEGLVASPPRRTRPR